MQRHKMAKISLDIPINEHIELKTECAKAKIKIKDFMHQCMLIGLKKLKKKQLHQDLLEGFQQIYRGEYTEIDLDKWEKEID